MMLLMSWFLVGAMEGAWLSPHEEDYRANLHQVIEPPSSITQPVLKTGRRIVGSDWQVHGYYPYWGNQDAEIPWSALSHLLYFSWNSMQMERSVMSTSGLRAVKVW